MISEIPPHPLLRQKHYGGQAGPLPRERENRRQTFGDSLTSAAMSFIEKILRRWNGPLTPALSPRERGNRRQTFGEWGEAILRCEARNWIRGPQPRWG